MYPKWRDLFYLIGFYTIICVILFFTQSKLLYFPSSEVSSGTAIKREHHTLGYIINNHGEKTIIVFHGNAGSAANRSYYAQMFPNSRIIINEYPGFGANRSENITQENIFKNARLLMQEVLKTTDKNNVILVGESLGTGISSQMASEFDIPKIILFTPYTSTLALAQQKFWFIPVKILFKHNYDNINNLKNYKGNVFILIAGQDKVIPPQDGQKLYDSLTAKKSLLIIASANHINWMNHWSQNQYKQVLFFVDSN